MTSSTQLRMDPMMMGVDEERLKHIDEFSINGF